MMDVAFSDEQDLLRDSARRFLSDKSPIALAREVTERGPHVQRARDLWLKMAAMGWTALGLPEDNGGQGQTLVDRAILAEEMGRFVTPAPWFSTVCLAGEAISAAGTAEQRQDWISRLGSGQLRATLALLEPSARMGPAGLGATAEANVDGYRFEGTKAFVADLGVADVAVVAARVEGEPALFVVDSGDLAPIEEPTLDATRPLGHVRLDGVVVPAQRLLGGEPCGWGAIERGLDRATAVLCAEMCGGARMALDLAVEYAKTRTQFGRAIGSFQGVSHRCAQMLLDVESARSLAYYAAWCCDEDEPSAAIAVSAAKAACGDAYRSCTAQAIQIHGGIGFTWEADLHLWYRRAFWSAAFLGDAVYHRERVASLLDL